MDISRANTEPYYRLLRFHESINRTIKFGFAALLHLQKETIESDNIKLLIKLIKETGEPWKIPSNWNRPYEVFNNVNQAFSELGIVRVYSAVDEFKVGIESELYRCSSYLSDFDLSTNDNNESGFDRFSKLILWLGHDPSIISEYQPIIKYFELARDCFVHRVGRASNAFSNFSNSNELKISYKKWNSQIEEKELPGLPTPEYNQIIKLKPRHVIMASDFCFKAANKINRIVISKMRLKGVVFSAAYHGLLKDDPISTDAYRTPEAIVHRILSDRLRVSNISPHITIPILREIGVWKDCVKKHSILY
jgi:hypothetical protein